MLEFRSINANDFEKFNKYRISDETKASEGAFATMFIWNRYYNLEVAENGEFLFLRFNIKNKVPSYFFPIGSGNLEKALNELFQYAASKGEKVAFRLVTRENAEKLEKIYGKRFDFTEDRDCFDYMYLTERMISLSGKKLHSKRNHLNYFLDNYNFEYKEVTEPAFLNKCADKAYEWVNSKTRNKNPFEMGAMESYFRYFFRFNQSGAAILVDGEIVAMSFGEKLCEDTALIQVELADENYRGSYQAINRFFCENEWKDYKYINREEDMGIEGLRKAKMAYRPVKMIEKYFTKYKG